MTVIPNNVRRIVDTGYAHVEAAPMPQWAHTPSMVANFLGVAGGQFLSECLGHSSSNDAVRAAQTVRKYKRKLEQKAKCGGKGEKKTEYSYTLGHKVNQWRLQQGDRKVTHVQAAEFFDLPPGARENRCLPAKDTVGRWWRDKEQVAIKAGVEERQSLTGAFGRCNSRRASELVAFETAFAKCLAHRRSQGGNVNPWVCGVLLRMPQWSERIQNMKWHGTDILFRNTYLKSFLHRHDFSPVNRLVHVIELGCWV